MEPILLSEWRREHEVSKDKLWKDAAGNQMDWVQQHLQYPVAVLLTKDDPDATMHCMDEVKVKVVSTHTSKSILLPVYCLEFGEIKLVLRHNFYDWCLKIWLPKDMEAPGIPKYMDMATQDGFYEGMGDGVLPDSDIQLCFRTPEEVYSYIWWILTQYRVWRKQ